ncbi:Retrovirus-related Pol polyprotein from transposon 297 [Araneus ventricosus]|uniref:Retrovirus-related Pol polyprotein from transposon 297 n=1 Tax=Araneus ventricosus TaxID=182803 RepID=A0A4Y2SRZ6_ARAVE|nr:Retrovirus-related Pol polyprotein from transposon 297 [Araneus ventricosus]
MLWLSKARIHKSQVSFLYSTPIEKRSSSSITLYTCHASAPPTALLDIRIGDIHRRVGADTGLLAPLLSGIVLDLKNKRWYFSDKPHHKICFKEDLDVNSLQTAGSIIANSCHLREEEGTPLNPEQKEKMSYLLEKFDSIFKPGGDPTPYVEHHINTKKHPPVSVPPYRMSPMKKELLRMEIEDLLEKDVIEERDSVYGDPVVLISKPDGKTRLCIDYRKLNEFTVPDSYPLSRMDDLLQSAKHSTFMSIIDLKSEYRQINVHPADRDKTAFVCPFGTFRYKRMPFGLRNAPATFQMLMDMLYRNLPAMAYLDDIIVLSSIFDQHLLDLETVFLKLKDYKLRANRSKCHFACSRVKYLGLRITSRGIELKSTLIKYQRFRKFHLLEM